MRKLSRILVPVALLLTVGCAHNVDTYFDGNMLNVGWDNQTHNVGIQWYSGVLVTGVTRENVEKNIEIDNSIGNPTETTDKNIHAEKIKYSTKVGRQITGYYVDALEAGATPEQLDKYTSESDLQATK